LCRKNMGYYTKDSKDSNAGSCTREI
jgi:hypothetical protein